MTSTLESASTLFGDTTGDNADFFGSLETTSEVEPYHETTNVHEEKVSENASVQDTNFTAEYHHQSSGSGQSSFSFTIN
jgi:hypothetical protein